MKQELIPVVASLLLAVTPNLLAQAAAVTAQDQQAELAKVRKM
jgi:hypothetical protein